MISTSLYIVVFTNVALPQEKRPWVSDNGDGTYKNPVLYADYSDPDVIRVGDDFYMVSSSFNCVPAIPILHSKDLVNWTIIGHAIERLPSQMFDKPQHGKGVWAPSIRYHEGIFWVYYGDPDLGIFMTKATRVEGPWELPILIREAKGWIDPCPLWDDDGDAYLVHAWAKSRVGFNSILTVNRMSADGEKILDEGKTVFDGTANHPTIEGPKFYKRNGYYYIFAPAGGVKPGWQTVLRSKNLYGPYEDKIVLQQGSTSVNGPHQGAWIETQAGESWFMHFQDRDAYGRIVHLQPIVWKNDWPVMGADADGDGTGEPVLSWKKPVAGTIAVPQASDEFSSKSLGLQWQWHANPSQDWLSLSAREGYTRLFAVALPGSAANLWDVPNLLLQKFSAPQFTATVLLEPGALEAGKAGLLVMGLDYSYLAVMKTSAGLRLAKIACTDADKRSAEHEEASVSIAGQSIFLRVDVDTAATCTFRYSTDGQHYQAIGARFVARPGRWIGTKVGLFCLSSSLQQQAGHVDVDWFRIE